MTSFVLTLSFRNPVSAFCYYFCLHKHAALHERLTLAEQWNVVPRNFFAENLVKLKIAIFKPILNRWEKIAS